jgi:hypothetical protein
MVGGEHVHLHRVQEALDWLLPQRRTASGLGGVLATRLAALILTGSCASRELKKLWVRGRAPKS